MEIRVILADWSQKPTIDVIYASNSTGNTKIHPQTSKRKKKEETP